MSKHTRGHTHTHYSKMNVNYLLIFCYFCESYSCHFVASDIHKWTRSSLLNSSMKIAQSVQFNSATQLCPTLATPWTAACQGSLSITNSQNPPKPMSIESMKPSNHLILCCIGGSTSTSVLPMNTQDWPPLGWTAWISLQSKGLSRVFSNTTVQKHQFFGGQLSSQSNSHIHTWPLEKPWPWLERPLLAKYCFCFSICYLGWS